MKKVRIIALISAVVTGLLVYVYLSSLERQSVTEVERAAVVVAIVDIPADTVITTEMITVAQLPVEAVAGGATTEASQVIGKISTSPIFTGEQLLNAKLITTGDKGNKTLAYTIEPGMRAITIAVSATSGLSNMLRPDDHIDIIGEFLTDSIPKTGSTASGSTGTQDTKISKTVMVLENITVLAVDSTLSVTEGTAVAYTTVTLQVTSEQAMLLSMAQYEGELRTILRSPLDEEITDEPSLTLDDVLK